MTVRETIAPGRGIMTVTHPGGTRTAIATIAEEVAAGVTVEAAVVAGVGAKTASGTATESATGTEIETGTEIGIGIAAGAGPSAELALEAGVENAILES